MYDKLISIVLPTFNRKEYLKLTLDCFLVIMLQRMELTPFWRNITLKIKMSVLLILQNMLMSDIVYPEQMI